VASNNYIYKMSNAGGMATVTRYTDMLAGNTTWNPWSPDGAFDALATVTLSSTTANIMFAGIPNTYKHLQFRVMGRGTYAAAGLTAYLNLNGNGNTGYRHHLYGNGSTASAYSVSGYGTIGGIPGSTVTANVFGGAIFDILDYANTSKTKTLRYLAGFDANGSGEIMLGSSYSNVTAAINSVDFTVDGSWTSGTTISLYGVK
jgi:hypothetical protein